LDGIPAEKIWPIWPVFEHERSFRGAGEQKSDIAIFAAFRVADVVPPSPQTSSARPPFGYEEKVDVVLR
jgi:hypothetical protein